MGSGVPEGNLPKKRHKEPAVSRDQKKKKGSLTRILVGTNYLLVLSQ